MWHRSPDSERSAWDSLGVCVCSGRCAVVGEEICAVIQGTGIGTAAADFEGIHLEFMSKISIRRTLNLKKHRTKYLHQ